MDWVCNQTGNSELILPPICSSRIRTKDKFYFTYGRVEVMAKLPSGDWLWPAIWMLPNEDLYGPWPYSGEIDIMESRGNRVLIDNSTNINIGSQQFATTLHFGFDWEKDGWENAAKLKQNSFDVGYDEDFHNFTMCWTPHEFSFFVDGELYHNIVPPTGGFYNTGFNSAFNESVTENPWNINISRNLDMAPFDQPFYLVLNVAVGGAYFPIDAYTPMPVNEYRSGIWSFYNESARSQFWEQRDKWYPTWKTGDGDSSALKVKSITVYAI